MVHLGIIPDGNRRWCAKNNLPHDKLITIWEKLFIDKIQNYAQIRHDNKKYKRLKEIDELSVYISSIDNYNRNDNTRFLITKTLNKIMNIILFPKGFFANEYLNEIESIISDLSFNFIGDLNLLSEETREKLDMVHKKCQGKFRVNLAVMYDYDADLKNYESEKNELYNRLQSNIDIIFRSGGEHRTSGFFPTKTIYSELYFEKKFWPDIELSDFNKCVKYLKTRHRRFGK